MRKYDENFKVEAIKLASEVGQTKAARELGIPANTLSSWTTKNKNGEIANKNKETKFN